MVILLQEAQRATYRAPECNMPPFLMKWPGQLSLVYDPHKNRKLVEDVEYFILVKFHQIPFRGSRGIVQNVSSNQRPRRQSLGKGSWVLASCQVSANSVQWFQRKSRKCLSKSQARAATLFFRSSREAQKLHIGCCTVVWEVLVWFPAYLFACWPFHGKEVTDVFGSPGACVRVGSAWCPWQGCPVAGLKI